MKLGFIDIGAPEIIIIGLIALFYLVFPIWGYREGSKRTIGATLGLLLGVFLGLIGIIIVYCTPKVKEQPFPGFQSPSKADELQKYKQLLDSGAITEEEYQTQKARILS